MPSSRRCSRSSASGSPSSRWPTGCSPGEEPEAGKALEKAFAADGIQVLTGARGRLGGVRRGRRSPSTLGDQEVTADKLLVAAGRTPNLAGIGLESLGIDADARVLETDERMRAGEKLWAVGDITGKGAFTHVSMYQAAVVVRDILGRGRSVGRLPRGQPGHLHRARGRLGRAERGEGPRAGSTSSRSRREDLGARGWIAKEEGLIKLVADRSRGILVGATVVGPSGGEILACSRPPCTPRSRSPRCAPCTSPTRRTTAPSRPRSTPSTSDPLRRGVHSCAPKSRVLARRGVTSCDDVEVDDLPRDPGPSTIDTAALIGHQERVDAGWPRRGPRSTRATGTGSRR